MQYNTEPMFVMATRQQWRQRNLNCISSRNPDCVAETETPLSLLCNVFQTVSSSVLCAALNAGSSTLSQPFRLYLQKHKHKNIFIVHSICPAMTPHKTSTLKIWGVNTLDSSLQTLREVVLSVCLIKLRCVFIYLGPYSDHLPTALQHVKKKIRLQLWLASQSAYLRIFFLLYNEQRRADSSGSLETWEFQSGSWKYQGTSARR